MIEEVKGTNSQVPKAQQYKKPNDIKSISNSIFTQMDQNSDGFVSPQEAKDFGFTTLGDSSLSSEQFFEKYKAYKDKTSTKNGILDGFRNLFTKTDDRTLRQFCELTPAQQKELVSRMEMFEATQKVIADDKTYSPEEHAYIKENANHFMNDVLAEYLEQFSSNRTISDGKIGSFRQGRFNDCWLLSAINTYTSTEEGRNNIEKRIKNNGDGTYSVTFQNPFNQDKEEVYTITDEELNGKYKDGATGDIDVRILEAASDKYLNRYAPEVLRSNGTMLTNDLITKPALMHRAFGYRDNIQFFVKEDDGNIYKRTSSIAQGEDGKAKVSLEYDNCQYKTFNDLITQSDFKEENLTVASFPLYRRTPKVATLDISTDDKSFLPPVHACNLEKRTNDTCTISNPYISSFPIPLKSGTFEEYTKALFYFPTQN